MKNIFKTIAALCLLSFGIYGAYLTHSNKPTPIYSDFADNVVNTTVLIQAIDISRDIVSGTATGGIIKIKIDNGHTKLYILSVAHILRSGEKLEGIVIGAKNGVLCGGLDFEMKEVEVDKSKDLALFEADVDGELYIKLPDPSLSILHSDNVYLHKVVFCGYPIGIGPMYLEGQITL
jgi:hypothetical protein